jgi:predicted thioesterase
MTSVGTRVELQHLAASAVGRTVRVTATLAAVDGRRLRFEVGAAHEDGEVVGRGVVERVVVDAARFVARITT